MTTLQDFKRIYITLIPLRQSKKFILDWFILSLNGQRFLKNAKLLKFILRLNNQKFI